LNLSNIRSLTLPLPPLEEQRRIVAHLDALQAKLDAVRAAQAATAAELDALLPSVLNQAFAGNL
jgi:type I restriction enzyme S subunit